MPHWFPLAPAGEGRSAIPDRYGIGGRLSSASLRASFRPDVGYPGPFRQGPIPSENQPGRIADLTALTDSLVMLFFSHSSPRRQLFRSGQQRHSRTRIAPESPSFPRLSADGRSCMEIRKWRRVRDSNPRYRCRHFAFRVRRFRPLSQLSSLRGDAPSGGPRDLQPSRHNFGSRLPGRRTNQGLSASHQ